jgi:hypothetical protein
MFTSTRLLKRIFSVRNLMCALFVVIALFTAWAIFCAEERRRGERLWNDYRANTTARGVKVDLKDVIPPDIPDTENFAAIPMIQDLFTAKEEGRPVPEWFAAAKLDEIKATLAQGVDGKSILDQWREEFVKHGVVPAGSGDSADVVLAALHLLEPELAQLREAGHRTSCKFPVKWEKGISALLPHLEPLQQTKKVYRLSMAAHLAKGNSAAAYRDFEDGLKIYSAMRTELALISGLNRISVLRSLDEGVVADQALSKWTDEDLEHLMAVMATVDLPKDLEFAIGSERAVINSIFDDLMTTPNTELAKLGDVMGIGRSLGAVSMYPRGWFRLSQVKTNQHFDRMLEGRWPMKTEMPVDPLLRTSTSRLARQPYLLFVLLAPSVDGALSKYARTKALHDQVQIACALERCRRKYGAYPDQLGALQPAFLASVPQDPIDGAPMRYRRSSDGGFELWSIGLNRIDDGGKLGAAKSEREQPDWVLQVPGKP